MNNNIQIPLDPKTVSKVYSGQPNCCMCGCKGKYTEASESSRSVATIVRNLNRAITEGRAKVEMGLTMGGKDLYISAETDNRVWVAWVPLK